MNPKLEKLYAEQERVEQKLEQARHQQQRLENRIRYISKVERAARNHKLITRGVAVEHIWPQVKPMTERAFFELMEAVLALPEAQSILQAHLPKTGGDP